jgi:hypothetical protein
MFNNILETKDQHPLKSWIDNKKLIHNSFKKEREPAEFLLDETYTKIDSIPGLKTSLFPHQKTIVRAMLDLEMNRDFDIMCNVRKYACTASAGVLSESVGSGKTIDILSVILMQKIPKICPDISALFVENNMARINHYSCIVRKKFHNILTPTVIFVGVGVINQWVNTVKTFTNLTFFTVFDVRDLQKLIDKISDSSINSYDIVLIKNGKVTRPIKFPTHIKVESKNLQKSGIYIYNVISNMRTFCWARVIIDDFDTIKLPPNSGIVNGLFTWYISSTTKKINIKYNYDRFKTTGELLLYGNYSFGNIMNNKILFKNLNICNDSEFVKLTNNINSPTFYAYVFYSTDNRYIGLLGILNTNEANEIMEMLNGDAIETAAERLGIKTNKVLNIFQNLLGKEYEKYKKSVDVLAFIEEIEPMQGRREPISNNPDLDDTYKKSDLFIRREINYNYPNLKSIIDNTKEEYTEIRNKTSIVIERVKSNIKNGECAICTNDLNDEDDDTLILKCCGTVVCGICCFGTIFLKKSSVGQCSNCRSQLNISSLIYLNSSFDLNKIVNEEIDEVDDIDDEKKSNCVKQNRTKMTAIIEIIKGDIPEERKLVDVNINNLMKGTNILPESTYKKVLIFANFDETIKNIKETLIDEDIKFWQLGGSHREINKTVELFTQCTDTCVMVINSMKHCSGLNLQTATDLIFAHKIIDPNIETQVIGRGQRLGRTTTLNVHFIMYNNEYEYMLSKNTIREII